MSTAVRTSRKAGAYRSEGRGQMRWKTKVGGGRLSRQQSSSGNQVGDSRISFRSFSPSSDDYTSVNFKQSMEAESRRAMALGSRENITPGESGNEAFSSIYLRGELRKVRQNWPRSGRGSVRWDRSSSLPVQAKRVGRSQVRSVSRATLLLRCFTFSLDVLGITCGRRVDCP